MSRVKATEEHARRARKAAAITSLCVIAFAAAFIALVLGLNQLSIKQHQQEIPSPNQVEVPTKPFYVLLIGSDTRKGTALYTGKPTEHAQVDQHSDIMTLVRVDPKDYKISLLTIPRDTVIKGENDKINSSLLSNNPQDVVQAVKRLTGLEADYYMMTTFTAFEDLIDALGGVDVDVPLDITVNDPGTGSELTVKAGENQHLNGAQTLALARARHEYGEDQDALRQSTVRTIEEAIIRRVLSYPDLVDVERLLPVVEKDVESNLDPVTLGLVIVDFIQHSDEITFIEGTGPHEGGPREGDGQWVIDDDQKTWKKIMKEFKKGNDYSDIVVVPTYAQWKQSDAQSSKSASSSSASSKSASSSSASSSKSASSSSSSSASSALG